MNKLEKTAIEAGLKKDDTIIELTLEDVLDHLGFDANFEDEEINNLTGEELKVIKEKLSDALWQYANWGDLLNNIVTDILYEKKVK